MIKTGSLGNEQMIEAANDGIVPNLSIICATRYSSGGLYHHCHSFCCIISCLVYFFPFLPSHPFLHFLPSCILSFLRSFRSSRLRLPSFLALCSERDFHAERHIAERDFPAGAHRPAFQGGHDGRSRHLLRAPDPGPYARCRIHLL